MDGLRLKVLGPVSVTVDGTELRLGPARQSALLSVLLCRLNTPASAGSLLEAVWGAECPDSGPKLVPTYVYRLRRVFAAAPHDGMPVILHGRDGYTLLADPDTLDLTGFTRSVHGALAHRSAGRTDAALAGLREALALWRGDPFGSLPGPLLESERSRLRELRLSALVARFEIELDATGPADLLGELRAEQSRQPFDERFAGLLMTALYRDGRQAEALEVYAGTVERLDAQLGVRPGACLRAVHQAVLSRDPRLWGRADPRPAGGAAAVGRPAVRSDLPAPTGDLLGRTAELASLSSHRVRPDVSTVLAVEGMPGIGKTALLVRAAHRVAPGHAAGHLYLSLHGSTPGRRPLAPGEALAALLATVGVTGADLPRSDDERAALWRAATSRRPLLLVLDDAAGDDQLAPLLPGAGGTVLVGSRYALGVRTADPVLLGPLDDGPARALLRRAAGAGAGLDTVPGVEDRLLQTCQGHPAALLATGHYVRRNPAPGAGAVAERIATLSGYADLLTMSLGATDAVPLARGTLDALTAGAREVLARLLDIEAGAPPEPGGPVRAPAAEDELVRTNLTWRQADGKLVLPRPIAACAWAYFSASRPDPVA